MLFYLPNFVSLKSNHMKKILIAVCGFFLLSTLTGCLTFIEDLLVKENGSGHFRRTLDMSEMVDMMKSFKDMMPKDSGNNKSEDDMPNMNDPKKFFEEQEALKKVDGISNVTSSSDTVKQIFILEFDYKNDVALNKALNEMLGENKKATPERVYTITNKTVTRTDFNMLSEMTEPEEKNKEVAEMMSAFMSEMKIKFTITVPGNIKSVNNKTAVISDDKKKLTFATNLKDLSEKITTTEMKVTY